MPIKIPDSLPATQILDRENIFVMTEFRALHQDIRPLHIIILNLMPTKVETETQLLRLLSNSPIQVEIELVQMRSHTSKNTSADHLLKFYKTFDDIKFNKYDGMIITGAPVEMLDYEQVDYWRELCEIFEWSKTNVYSTFHICWGAQAGLYYHYGIPKYPLQSKMFGVFRHTINHRRCPLMRGFDDEFYAPHSRHTEVRKSDIEKIPDLTILSESEESGVYIIISNDGRRIFVMGHSEYDRNTLANEYFRDVNKGLDIAVPKNYFPGDDPSQEPILTWRGHSALIYANWLNYYVYQTTPYNLHEIEDAPNYKTGNFTV